MGERVVLSADTAIKEIIIVPMTKLEVGVARGGGVSLLGIGYVAQKLHAVLRTEGVCKKNSVMLIFAMVRVRNMTPVMLERMTTVVLVSVAMCLLPILLCVGIGVGPIVHIIYRVKSKLFSTCRSKSTSLL